MFRAVRNHAARLTWALALAATLGLATAPAAMAEDYPTKPVKIMVPVSPGGPMDMIGRLVGEKLSEKWGQQFVVENRPGGGQVIATNEVVHAPADGYTLVIMSHVFTMNPWLFKSLPYEISDLTPITRMTITPLIMAVNPDLPFKTVQDVVDYAKANPGKLSFGSSGPSSSLRFAGELLKYKTGIDMVHVPYKGNGPMTVAIVSGEIDLGFVNPVSLPFIQDGRLRALAITSAERSPSLPDLPTVAESGVPGYEAGSWFGIMAPAGTPPEIVEKLNTAINEILDMPDVQAKLAAVEAKPSGTTTAEMATLIDSELEKWRDLIQTTGITIK